MKMSSDFAQTVAAVAPVVWLVGAVEVQQVAKQVATWWQDGARRLEQAEAAMASAHDEDSIRDAGELVFAAPQYQRMRPVMGLFAGWGVITSFLASATFISLGWLGDAPDKAHDHVLGLPTADFCYWAISIGITWVTCFPIVVMMFRVVRSLRQRNALRSSIIALARVAETRVRQGEDPGTVAPDSSPTTGV
ncbi:hypothetical protein [Streptomyces mirabilis]|uniref:hypothetical protein n=1 Tax=Streptomyces mirabilis TaxID=68239 RepID=UPI0036C1128A